MVGADVEVILDAQGNIESVTLISQNDLMKQKMQNLGNSLGGSSNLFSSIVATMGKPVLICLAALFLTATIFDFATVSVSAMRYSQKHGVSLMDGLSAGRMLLFFIALLAPFCVNFTQNKKAYLSYFAPLAFLVVTALSVMIWGSKALGAASFAREFGVKAKLSFSLGFYLFLAISGYLSFLGFKQFKRLK